MSLPKTVARMKAGSQDKAIHSKREPGSQSSMKPVAPTSHTNLSVYSAKPASPLTSSALPDQYYRPFEFIGSQFDRHATNSGKGTGTKASGNRHLPSEATQDNLSNATKVHDYRAKPLSSEIHSKTTQDKVVALMGKTKEGMLPMERYAAEGYINDRESLRWIGDPEHAKMDVGGKKVPSSISLGSRQL